MKTSRAQRGSPTRTEDPREVGISRPAASKCFLASLIFLAGLLVACDPRLPNYPPAYREYAYVTNGASDSVSVIDLLHFRVVKNIPVGKGPTGVAVNPAKNEVYVVNTD